MCRVMWKNRDGVGGRERKMFRRRGVARWLAACLPGAEATRDTSLLGRDFTKCSRLGVDARSSTSSPSFQGAAVSATASTGTCSTSDRRAIDLLWGGAGIRPAIGWD